MIYLLEMVGFHSKLTNYQRVCGSWGAQQQRPVVLTRGKLSFVPLIDGDDEH